jgi:hypothetical protein
VAEPESVERAPTAESTVVRAHYAQPRTPDTFKPAARLALKVARFATPVRALNQWAMKPPPIPEDVAGTGRTTVLSRLKKLTQGRGRGVSSPGNIGGIFDDSSNAQRSETETNAVFSGSATASAQRDEEADLILDLDIGEAVCCGARTRVAVNYLLTLVTLNHF